MELVQNLTLAASLGLVVGACAWALQRQAAAPAWALALGGLLAFPALFFAGEMLVALLVPPLGPLPMPAMALLALVPAALTGMVAMALLHVGAARRVAWLLPALGLVIGLVMMLSFFALWGLPGILLVFGGAAVVVAAGWLLRGLRPGTAATSFLVLVPLALLAVPTGLLGVVIGLQEPQMADHHWTTEVRPEGGEAYAVTLPFLTLSGDAWRLSERAETRGRMLDLLRDRLHVAEGQATVRVLDRAHLEVAGQGPVRLEARHAFYGTTGQREAFTGWVLPDLEVRRAGGGTAPVEVTVDIRLSGGEGHSCWAHHRFAAEVAPGQVGMLAPGEPWAREADEEGTRLLVVCA